MITTQILESQDPIAYAKRSYEGFKELLMFIEAEKANFQGESLMYFSRFAASLVDCYLAKMADPEPLAEDLTERKENLANVDDQMVNYANQMRMMVG